MLEYYTGADIELLVREAALTALREDPNATEVTMEDFSKAMSKIRATLTPEMIKFYESWWDRFKTSQVRAREQRKAEIFI
jgi:transitional endoplasmic reticulum ATPase